MNWFATKQHLNTKEPIDGNQTLLASWQIERLIRGNFPTMPKFMTKGRLIAAMARGRAEGFEKVVAEGVINIVDPAYHYPVTAVLRSNRDDGTRRDSHERVVIEVRTRLGGVAPLVIDIPAEVYRDLPEANDMTTVFKL